MKSFFKTLSLKTTKKFEISDITRNIIIVVTKSKITNGLVNVWVPHTTAGLIVNENDHDLWKDILSAMMKIIPLKANYHHNAKYSHLSREQNAHAHILSCIIKSSLSIPLKEGKMVLGTWQSILFFEFDGPRTRSLQIQILGK
jgi:secondary thiamine-phosphate synthase enzyme